MEFAKTAACTFVLFIEIMYDNFINFIKEITSTALKNTIVGLCTLRKLHARRLSCCFLTVIKLLRNRWTLSESRFCFLNLLYHHHHQAAAMAPPR